MSRPESKRKHAAHEARESIGAEHIEHHPTIGLGNLGSKETSKFIRTGKM